MSADQQGALFGPTNPATTAALSSHRYVSCIELLVEHEQQYRKLHAEVWPDVVAAIKQAGIENYSIHVLELGEKKYLFSYFEYSGDDADNDFAKLAETPVIRDRWWPITKPCQQRLPGTGTAEHWTPLEQLMFIA